MKLEQASLMWDVVETETILKSKLKQNPQNAELWIKLILTELQYPFEDFQCALQYIENVYEIDNNHRNALILEAAIKWHYMGYLDEKTFEKLNWAVCLDKKETAVLYYLKSLYYRGQKNVEMQKEMIEKSLNTYCKYVYPFEDLAMIFLSKSNNAKAVKMLKKAVENVKTVMKPEDRYDFTDVNQYIAEFVTGIALSAVNFESLKKKYQKSKEQLDKNTNGEYNSHIKNF